MALPEWFKGDPAPLERKTEMRTFRVTMTCPECGQGEMLDTGGRYATAVPGRWHQCDACGVVMAFEGRSYPAIRHEPST